MWIPTAVATNWAPYRNGNWVWAGGFGWTWVAAEPWGWAPFHYGRWYFSAAYQHWAWYPPPPARIAPAWSPALVGFIGFNIGAVNAGVGFGNIGWVPLAPYEALHPTQYRNIEVNGAVTSVTRQNFQNGRFGNPTVVTAEQVRSFHPMAVQGALPIVPTTANLRFTQRSVAPSLAVRSPAPTWSRFNGNRGAYAPRSTYTQPQTQYYHPESASYARPQYNRPPAYAHSTPGYAHAAAPAAHPQPRRGTTMHATHYSDEHRDR